MGMKRQYKNNNKESTNKEYKKIEYNNKEESTNKEYNSIKYNNKEYNNKYKNNKEYKEECKICYNIKYLVKQECNHNICELCLSRIYLLFKNKNCIFCKKLIKLEKKYKLLLNLECQFKYSRIDNIYNNIENIEN